MYSDEEDSNVTKSPFQFLSSKKSAPTPFWYHIDLRLSFIFNIHMGVGNPYNTLDGIFFFVHNWEKLEIFHHG